MKTKSLVVGYVFALALLLFAQRHRTTAEASGIHAVVDLSRAVNSNIQPRFVPASYRKLDSLAGSGETLLEAPATASPSLWTVDQIPPERLIAPLVVLDVRERAGTNPDYALSVLDIANWERIHGEVPLGSVVMLLTGLNSKNYSADYSADAARFLVEGRDVVGLGTDANNRTRDAFSQYALLHSAYLLCNVSNLDRVPVTGGIVMVAPAKLRNQTNAPVRILAMLK